MYYRRVNRGLSFTRPGIYVFGLVLLVGMIAVTTGINGLYVFLSAGLGGFIVSGMLSERAMKSSSVKAVTATMVDAATPFALTFTIENSSSWFSVFAMQTLFLTEPPPFRLISKAPKALGGGRIARMPPATTQLQTAMIGGLPRGEYQQILAMQLTTFPFGVLEKFKLLDIPASIVVAPRVDASFYDELAELMRRLMSAAAAEREFYTHRPYAHGDAQRDVDWKKSANHPQNAWVTRVYKAPSGTDSIRVVAPWAHAAGQPDAESYERYLSRVRTAVKVLEACQKPYVVDFGGGLVAPGHDAAMMALATAPAYVERERGVRILDVADAGVAKGAPELHVSLTGCEWLPGRAA